MRSKNLQIGTHDHNYPTKLTKVWYNIIIVLENGLKIGFSTSTCFKNVIILCLIQRHGNSRVMVWVPANSGSHVPAYLIRDDIIIQLSIMTDMNWSTFECICKVPVYQLIRLISIRYTASLRTNKLINLSPWSSSIWFFIFPTCIV